METMLVLLGFGVILGVMGYFIDVRPNRKIGVRFA